MEGDRRAVFCIVVLKVLGNFFIFVPGAIAGNTLRTIFSTCLLFF